MRSVVVRGIVALAITLIASNSAVAAVLFSDPVELSGGWTLIDGGFTTGVQGLVPSAGITFWGSTYDQPADVGLFKTFPALKVQVGTYTVSIDTAAPYGPPKYRAVALSEYTDLGLTGLSSPRTIISAGTPPAATPSWTTWSFSYLVPPGSADVGNTIGFRARFQPTGFGYTTMLDNLRISYDAIPEPTAAMAALGLGLMWLSPRRPRRRA
jgi:hypothetical protein